VSLSVKLFTIKGNLVFMNNLYHKIAVVSLCTTLGLALGANKEAKAATFTLTTNITFEVVDASWGFFGIPTSFDGQGDKFFPGGGHVSKGTDYETAGIAEFDINSLFLTPNTVISSAVFQTQISTFRNPQTNTPPVFVNPGSLGIFGYVGNGTGDLSDFEAGVLLSSVDISSLSPGDTLNFDVTPFVNQRVSNRNPFAGFAIRALGNGIVALGGTDFVAFPDLIVETAEVAEPVPEPTTILTAAIALGWGGWLKRKNSSQQNKTKSSL
jgi:hypothetical protein